jgi:predicted RNA-binding protein YlqC (UPF0109 family)
MARDLQYRRKCFSTIKTETAVTSTTGITIATLCRCEGAQSSLVEIRVSKTDLGRVIGRQGHTVEALRTILSSVAAKDKKKVLVDVIE